jgi:hypothetical protein
MWTEDLNGMEAGRVSLHPQRPQSSRYSDRTCINLWSRCTRSANTLQITQGLRSEENRVVDDLRSGRRLQNDLGEGVRTLLLEFPLASCKRLCIHFRPTKACEGHVIAEIAHGFPVTKVTSRWVSYTLDTNKRTGRAGLSSELLEVLTSQGRNEFDHVIMGDESRYYFESPHAEMWAPSRDEVPERIKQGSDTEKCLMSIILSVNKIHSPLDVPKYIG